MGLRECDLLGARAICAFESPLVVTAPSFCHFLSDRITLPCGLVLARWEGKNPKIPKTRNPKIPKTRKPVIEAPEPRKLRRRSGSAALEESAEWLKCFFLEELGFRV